MDKIPLAPPSEAYKLLNPGLVVLISAGDKKRDNLFSVTWNMPVRKEPGMVALLSGKRHFTYPLIERTGEFGISIPDASLVNEVLGCGRTSGRDLPDKFARFGLGRCPGEQIKAPLVEQAIAHIECRVCQVVDLGRSALLIAHILAAAVDPDHFHGGEWTFDKGLKLLHHLGGDRFCVSEKALSGQVPDPSS